MFKYSNTLQGANTNPLQIDSLDFVLPEFQFPEINVSHVNVSQPDLDIEELLRSLSSSDLSLNKLGNLTENFLSGPLWSSLQPYNWREQAVRMLQQPEYIVMLILCMIGLFMNILSIVAVCHIKHSLTMHLKLIINLATSDILIVFSILILITNKVFNTPPQILQTKPNDRLLKACFFASVNALNIFSFLISLLNLLAMALDHYVAIMMPLRYNSLLSKRRGYIILTLMWLLSSIGGFSNFIVGRIVYKGDKIFNFCEIIMNDEFHAEMLIFAVTILCLFVISLIYTKIYLEVKRLQSLARLIPNYSLHNSKAIITTLVIIGTFIVCWLPNCIFQITMIIQIQYNNKVVYKLFNQFLMVSKCLHILQLLNCIADPIIYAVRLKIVRRGYTNFLTKLREKFARMKYICVYGYSRHRKPSFFTNGQNLEMSSLQIGLDLELLYPDIHHSNGRSVFCKHSDESDLNENEIIPMDTITLIHSETNGLELELLHSDTHHYSNGKRVFCKLSDESDLNENEIIPMVTFAHTNSEINTCSVLPERETIL